MTTMTRNKSVLIGGFIVLLVSLTSLFAPLLAPHDPMEQHIMEGLTDDGAPVPPCAQFPLGTDRLGRDVLSRLLYGSRVSLKVGVVANTIILCIGVLFGLIAGYYGGWIDQIMLRLVDLILSFPFLLLVIALVSIGGKPGVHNIYIALGIVGWTTLARIARSKVLSIKEKEFVESSRAIGATDAVIILRHILPNIAGPVLVMFTLGIASIILTESVLSYLGLGIQPPAPSWGGMIFEGQPYYRIAPWLIFAPGLAILLTVVGFNLLGDGLRDILDPRE